MKEVTEKGTVYVVSDNYPKIPYTKQIKFKGEQEPEPEIDLATLTDTEFRRLLLENAGYKVKK